MAYDLAQQMAGFNPGFMYDTPRNRTTGKKIKSKLFGSPDRMVGIPTMSPQQMQITNLLGQLGLQGAQELYPRMMGDPYAGFDPLAEEATSNFYQQTVPTLAERFTSMGAGAQRSSAFPSILGAAGADLSRGLASDKAQYGLNRMGQQSNFISSLISQGMAPQFQPSIMPGGRGFFAQSAETAAKLLPYLMMLA